MRRLRPLLALALVPLAAGPALGDAPDLCSKLPDTAVCVSSPETTVTKLAGLDGDPARADLCDLIHQMDEALWQALCRGTYTSSEICLMLDNGVNLGEYGEQIRTICMPLVATICNVTDICATPRVPLTESAAIRAGSLDRVVDLPIG